MQQTTRADGIFGCLFADFASKFAAGDILNNYNLIILMWIIGVQAIHMIYKALLDIK